MTITAYRQHDLFMGAYQDAINIHHGEAAAPVFGPVKWPME